MTEFSDKWTTVFHVRFNQCFQAIMKCHSTFGRRLPRSLRIVGFSGTGKSYLIAEVLKRFPPETTALGVRIPVLCIEIPSPPTIKTLLIEILKALNDPDPTHGTTINMEFRALKLLKNAGVELLLVDEAQHFVGKGSKVSAKLVANMFKTLINKTRLPVVILGTPSSRKLFNVAGQLRSRIPQELTLPAFNWEVAGERETFMGIVSAQLPLGYSNDDYLLSEETGLRLWFATYGVLRFVTFMLEELRDMAPKHEVMNSAVLSEAFRQRVWAGAKAHRDPFDEKFDGRPLVFDHEPFFADEDEGAVHEAAA